MVKTDGKVIWIDEARSLEFIEQGWRFIQNPKETYYPQYDQTIGRGTREEAKELVEVVSSSTQNILGIIVL